MKSIFCTLTLLFATSLLAQQAAPAPQYDDSQAQSVYTEPQTAVEQMSDVAEPQPAAAEQQDAPAETQAAPAEQESVPVMDQALPDSSQQQPTAQPDYDETERPAVASTVTADYVTLPGDIGTLRRDGLAHGILAQ